MQDLWSPEALHWAGDTGNILQGDVPLAPPQTLLIPNNHHLLSSVCAVMVFVVVHLASPQGSSKLFLMRSPSSLRLVYNDSGAWLLELVLDQS